MANFDVNNDHMMIEVCDNVIIMVDNNAMKVYDSKLMGIGIII